MHRAFCLLLVKIVLTALLQIDNALRWAELYIKEKTMEYIIAVYRSRNVSMRVYNYLIGQNQPCAIVSTPQGAGVGCGLSVKFSRATLGAYGHIVSQGETFVGFFLVKVTLHGTTITRL